MRENWTSKAGFILAATGSAVGLGNLWKFPYTVGMNGGGAFVLIYLFLVFVIGIPLMLTAITLGRKTQLSVYGAYKSIDRRWTFVGALGVICSFIVLAFYSTVGGWTLYYFKTALLGDLVTTDSEALQKIFHDLMTSPGNLIFYQTIFLLATALIVLKGIQQGIEKYSKWMMSSLFILLLMITVRSLTLPGSMEGIKYLFIPDFSMVTPTVLKNALGQMFFSLSIGMGSMITYGSYLSKKINLLHSAVMIPILDTSVALIAGLAIIPAVFAFGFEPSEGPSLMFITLPAVFASMPMGNLFAILFFILVIFAAITSSISMLEIAVSYFVDERKTSRNHATIITTSIIYVLGIPASLSLSGYYPINVGHLSLFDLYDQLSSNILLTTGAFFMTIFVGWVLKPKNAIAEIESSSIHFRLAPIWSVLVRYVLPIAILTILIESYRNFFQALFH